MKAQIYRVAVLILLCTSATVGTASAQDELTKAKDLYQNAAYEDALALLDAAIASNTNPELRKYRALCLAALGRTADAQNEFAAIVGADPFFVLDARELSPRLVALFNDTRRQMLPDAVKRAYDDAKAQFQSGDRAQARHRFDAVRRLLDDPMLPSDAELKSLRVVVDGYYDLLSTPPRPVAAVPAAPTPAAAPTTASSVAAAPAAARPEPRASVSRPPVTLKQTLPAWRPDGASTGRVLTGAVKVNINENGRVTSAVMVRRIHPLYDRELIEAASSWLYLPATLDGKPVPSEKTVEVELSPR